MTAKERYVIASNIAARIGLDHPNFITEYSRAISALHGLDSLNAMVSRNVTPNQPAAQNLPPQQPNNVNSEPLGTGGIGSAAQTVNPPQMT